MATITRFEEIEAWKTARDLTRLVYQQTSQGSFARDFGLRDQIRRASVSVMSNIAEGFESQTQQSFIKYLGHAKGSCGEVRSQLYVALDQRYLSETEFQAMVKLCERASRQLHNFILYLQTTPNLRRVKESHNGNNTP